MESCPITSLQMERGKLEAAQISSYRALKITADGNCNYEIGESLLLRRKTMTKQAVYYKIKILL